MRLQRKQWIPLVAVLMTLIFAGQLIAATGFTADSMNAGPRIAVVKLMDDENVDWARDDILSRLDAFVEDDPFLRNRIAYYDLDSKDDLSRIDGDIIIYLSHGGARGLMIGDSLMTWLEMAEFITKSDTSLHLFGACKSKEIIKFGPDNSAKYLYTVPGVWAAEIITVEITSVVMLALGFDQSYVDDYRTTELTIAKDLLESGVSYHPLDFESIILDEIYDIEQEYDDLYAQQTAAKDGRYKTYSLDSSVSYSNLPQEVRSLFEEYYPYGSFTAILEYIENYYSYQEHDDAIHASLYGSEPCGEEELCWICPDPTEANVFTSGTYSGEITFSNGVVVTLLANENKDGELISITFNDEVEGEISVTREKVDGIWQEPNIGRNHARTGGFYVDSCSSVDTTQNWYSPLAGWQYRKSHLITGTAGASTNYQISITVHYGSGIDSGENVYLDYHAQSDFDDVRFVDADETTILNYWMATSEVGVKATYWVEIHDNLDSNTVIYIYYGNTAAESASNGFDTFPLFDDFNRMNNAIVGNGWTEDQYGSGTLSIESNTLRIYQAQNYYCHIEKEGSDLSDFVVQAKIKAGQYGGVSWRPNLFVYWSTYDWISIGPDAGYMEHNVEYNYANQINFVHGPACSMNTWYYYRIIVCGTSVTAQYSIDGLAWNTVVSLTRYADWSGPPQLIVLGKGISQSSSSYSGSNLDNNYATAGSFGLSYADDIFLRKYVSIEPVHGIWGEEQNLINMNEWSFRKLHVVQAEIESGTSCQVPITVHYGTGMDSTDNVYLKTHCQEDFGDIRFTSGDGITLLDQWIESYTLSDTATFWIELAGSPKLQHAFYIYYGNAAVESASNGFDVFPLFDDFNRLNSATVGNGWTEDQYDSGTLSIDGNTLKIFQAKNYYCHIERSAPNEADFVVQAKIKAGIDGGVSWRPNLFVYWNTYDWISIGPDTGYMQHNVEYNYADQVNFVHGAACTTNVWYFYRIVVSTDAVIAQYSTNGQDWNSVANLSRYSDWNGAPQLIVVGKGISQSPNSYPNGNLDNNYAIAEGYGTSYADDVFLRKYIASELTHGIWSDEENSGIFQSNGDYLFVPTIPVDAGWHGPALVRALSSAFTVEQMDSFSVELSLFHNGLGERRSITSVNLRDVNDATALSLRIIDDDQYSTQDLVAGYYWWDNAGYAHEDTITLANIPGDYTGTLSMRYDPHQGILVKLGEQDEVLLSITDASYQSRLLTSLIIESLRYFDYPEHDERIDDITVSYAFSEYTVFDEDCGDMDGFYKDLTIDDVETSSVSNLEPTITDGSITSQDGYLTLNSVSSGTFWHGPVYAKALDRPFRLYQLSDFSVDAEFLAGTSSQGLMQVALYDDSMNFVVGVTIDDYSSSASAKMSTTYKTPGGLTTYHSGSYVSGGFEKVGKIWFDGTSVKSSIEGDGTQTISGAGLDDDVIISYIVIFGAGYASYPLSDMRIHDIHLEVDVNAVPPGGGGSEPVECDGTVTGQTEDKQWTITPPSENPDPEEPESWWTGPWPRYHFKVDETDSQNRRLMLEFSVDIIGDYRLEDSEITTGGYTMSAEEAASKELQFNSLYTEVIVPIITIMKYAIAIANGIATILSWTAAVEPGTFMLAYMAYITLVMVYNLLLVATLIETFDDPFDRAMAFIDATIFTILPMTITTGCAVLYYALRAVGSTKLANHKPSPAGIIKAALDGLYLVWWIDVIYCLWSGQIPF